MAITVLAFSPLRTPETPTEFGKFETEFIEFSALFSLISPVDLVYLS